MTSKLLVARTSSTRDLFSCIKPRRLVNFSSSGSPAVYPSLPFQTKSRNRTQNRYSEDLFFGKHFHDVLSKLLGGWRVVIRQNNDGVPILEVHFRDGIYPGSTSAKCYPLGSFTRGSTLLYLLNMISVYFGLRSLLLSRAMINLRRSSAVEYPPPAGVPFIEC